MCVRRDTATRTFGNLGPFLYPTDATVTTDLAPDGLFLVVLFLEISVHDISMSPTQNLLGGGNNN